jgi:hypothetical protein
MEIQADTKCSVGDNRLVSIAKVEISARKGRGRSIGICSALSLLLVLAPTAAMAGPLACIGQVGPYPIFNPTSTSGAVANFSLACTGGVSGSPVLVNFDYFMNFPVINSGSWILTDGASNFSGALKASNLVEFQNVSFNPPGNGVVAWTVENILVNPSLGRGGTSFYENISVSAAIPISNPQQLVAANGPETLNNFQGGSSSTPVFLPSGDLVGQVTGAIGGFGSQDYYSFYWSGGDFSATASIAGAPSAASYLLSEGIDCNSGGTAMLNSSDSFTSTIGIANLAAGQYCIGLNANSVNDPAFALTFNTPVIGPAPAPEPSGFVLLSIGVGMIGALRLKKRSREYSRFHSIAISH